MRASPANPLLISQRSAPRLLPLPAAAVVGGVQSMALSCFDEALSIPTEAAQRLALRTQQIIAHETGAADTIDPMAGSYYVEWLTDQLERQAQAIMDRVEDMGGAVAAIESGYVQSEIQEAAVTYQREIEQHERIIVGVNDYTEGEEQPPTLFRPNTTVGTEQVERLKRIKATRDTAAVDAALQHLRAAARGTDPLMPPILEAVKAYATLGEMCGVLREEWGEYRPPTVV